MSRPHGPWIDVHAHPGRCFLAGLDDQSPLVRSLGRDSTRQALADAGEAGMAAVSLSTVADLLVIGPTPAGGLAAQREFQPGEAKLDHQRQLAGLESTFSDGRRQIRVVEDILTSHEAGVCSAFICCEGADFLDGDLDALDAAHRSGVKVITLVHYRVNELGDIQTEPPRHGGLTSFGKLVVERMNALGIVVDLAHATFQTTVDALEVSGSPMMISHSHLARPGSEHPRLLTEEHARVVADAGGLIGAWPAGVTATSLADYVDEIRRLIDVVGVDHVAIGTDLDANYKPVLTEYNEFSNVADLLREHGLTAAEADQILGGNAFDLFRSVWH